jgi:glycosyltransferase involved in cell wall biosynthesis
VAGASPNAPDGSQAESLDWRLERMEERIRRLSELVARAYEGTPRAAADLLQARRRDSYERAYARDPLVSVRIGAYRGGDALFDRAIASVATQTYANWEAIVVCDGSDEPTAARIAELRDPRFRCVQRPRNGPYPDSDAARWQVAGTHPFNEAFALAHGAWIAPLDQDDAWTPDHLEVLLDAARARRGEVVYGVARVIVGAEGETYFGAWPPALADFGFQTAIHHAGLTAFLYDVNAHLLDEPADWNLARRMLEAGVRFDFVDRVVASYHVDPGARAFGWWQRRLQERGAFEPAQPA